MLICCLYFYNVEVMHFCFIVCISQGVTGAGGSQGERGDPGSPVKSITHILLLNVSTMIQSLFSALILLIHSYVLSSLCPNHRDQEVPQEALEPQDNEA